jgi:hypothetical protein
VEGAGGFFLVQFCRQLSSCLHFHAIQLWLCNIAMRGMCWRHREMRNGRPASKEGAISACWVHTEAGSTPCHGALRNGLSAVKSGQCRKKKKKNSVPYLFACLFHIPKANCKVSTTEREQENEDTYKNTKYGNLYHLDSNNNHINAITPPIMGWKKEIIQGVPRGKVNILGGYSIGHSKQKSVFVHVSYSEQFPR